MDQGVAYKYDIHTTGAQYDFDKNSPWLDDDSPGHGASYSDKETQIIPGNTFDFSYTHGMAIKNAGYSFTSASDEAVLIGDVNLKKYPVIDYLTGEEKTGYFPKDSINKHYEVYPKGMLEILDQYLTNGGNMMISGAHIGTDIKLNGLSAKAESILKFKWRTNHASRLGVFYSVDTSFMENDQQFLFNTAFHPEIYTVEAADAIEPADSLGKTIMRYRENNMSAAVSYDGDYKIIAIGFPFETIIKESERNLIMKKILDFLNMD